MHPVVLRNEPDVMCVVRPELMNGRLVILGIGMGGPFIEKLFFLLNLSADLHTGGIDISMTILIANCNGVCLWY